MNTIKFFTISIALLFIQACSHPIEIVGKGDVSSVGGRNCTLVDFNAGEDVCDVNLVYGDVDYVDTYTAEPHEFWLFDHWENYCAGAVDNTCSFNVPATAVRQFWGQTLPPLRAVFAQHKLTGPVLPDSGIALNIGGPNLSTVGYQKKEFFLEGTAHSFTPELSLPNDGKLVVTADPDTGAGSYKTRLVVVRPVDPTKFNGTVIVEWLNVTAGSDNSPDWIMAHNHFIRSGYAWVGVSAQAVGVNNIKGGAQAARYASLLHPGDSYSYSIFSHVGLRAQETASKLLGGLTAERVLAVGESQSASRLVTYINAVHPIESNYDGFLVHSRSGSGSSIRQSPLDNPVSYPAPAPIRNDLNVPVMVVMAEGDVIFSNLAARQPDTPMFRQWEMAGTSHADAYTIAGLGDPGDGSGALKMFGYLRVPFNPFGCTTGVNAGAHHWIVQAAFDGLDNWVRTVQDPLVADIAPAQGTLLEVISDTPVVLARDLHGNALGGVRSPQVDAPVATLGHLNGGPSFCGLFGSTTPFTVTEILNLYPTKADFMASWLNEIYAGVANGFLLQADAGALWTAANAWDFPN